MMSNAQEKAVRRCVISRTRAHQSALLRLGLDPEGRPFVDLLGRAPGRGVYVTATREALAEALSPKGLGRAFRGAAKPLSPQAVQELLADTEARLSARLLELISLARRAGVVEIGMDAALQAIKAAGAGLVIVVAKDQSARSLRMIRSALGETELIQAASKRELGACLGRELVGVVAVRPGKLAARITGEAKRLAGFEGSAIGGAPQRGSGQSEPIAR